MKPRFEVVLELSGWNVWDNVKKEFVAGFGGYTNGPRVYVAVLRTSFATSEEAAKAYAEYKNAKAGFPPKG